MVGVPPRQPLALGRSFFLRSACPSESESEAQDLLPPRLVVLEGCSDSSGDCWVREGPLGERWLGFALIFTGFKGFEGEN